MATFPTLEGGSTAKYPLVRRRHWRTGLYIFEDLSEQTFSKGEALAEFDMTFNNISTNDKETLRAFFNARQGSFDCTWSLVLPDPSFSLPTTYVNMEFVPGSMFEATETVTGRWNVVLKIRQTNPL